MATDPYSSPLAYFGNELKRLRLRLRAGITQADVGQQTNYALPTVSAYETGTRIPSADFAERADKLFGTDGDFTRLQRLVEQVSVRPWFRDRVDVERKAIEIREYESYQVPGLLQTEDYVRAITKMSRPVLPDEAIERVVALRMTRQQILIPDGDLPVDRQHTPRLWAIIDESALHHIVGSPQIMQEQIDHLIDMMRLPHITIQIVPLAKVSPAFGRAFAVLVSKNNSAVIYLEDPGAARYIRERDEVDRYTTIFDHMRMSALNDEESLRLLEGLK
ncbi:MAG: helix-turn-helix transcriptional regulator [Streptosporangiaceae bacterium]|jgi:transcriptional regulator with XRE-family HTH domain